MNNWNINKVPAQNGKIAIVTGANSGIGYETSLAFAKKEITVIMACRNIDKGEKAKKKILSSVKNANLKVMQMDLSSLKSVKAFSDKFKNEFKRLDLLVNNAGIMMSPYEITEDGFENQLGTNYLGHFALTGYLISVLQITKYSRVITLSSLSYKWSKIQFDDLHFENGYSKKKAYGQSKMACLVFAYELQRRLSSTQGDCISLAAHPGLSNTNLDRHFPAIIRPLGALFLQDQKKGVLSTLYASFNDDLKGGEYIGPNGFQEMRGDPTIVDSDQYSKSEEIGEKLWRVSEQLTKVEFFEP